MAMMKPSNNNSPGGNQTETDEDAASCKKLRCDISALKLKETAATSAASNSSKILGDASEEVISSKSKCIRDLRKQIPEQLKVISNGKALQGKADRLQAEVKGFVVEKSLWMKEKKSVSKSNQSPEKKLVPPTNDSRVCPAPAENGQTSFRWETCWS
jgi:hypothetical protein